MKKTIIIIIIIIAIAGAGILAYSALNKGGSADTAGAGSDSIITILPYGTDLDFKPIKSFNNSNRFFPYPQVTPPEIGTNSSALVP